MNGVAPEQRVVRKRALTEELVAIRTQKADVLRQIEQIAKRQKTGGLPTKASELLAGNNKLVLQMEQRNRAEKMWVDCGKILQDLLKNQQTKTYFGEPVKESYVHNYYAVIKNPMDLGTVKAKNENRLYKTIYELRDDVRLTFNNCRIFNPPGNHVRAIGDQSSERFEKKWAMSALEYHWEAHIKQCALEDAQLEAESKSLPDKLQEVTAELQELTRKVEAHGTAQPPGPGREMTFEEKRKLSHSMGSLAGERLVHVLQIIAEGPSAPVLDDEDEYELDIDALDPVTCWKLQSYVDSVLAEQAAKQPGQAPPPTQPAAAAAAAAAAPAAAPGAAAAGAAAAGNGAQQAAAGGGGAAQAADGRPAATSGSDSDEGVGSKGGAGSTLVDQAEAKQRRVNDLTTFVSATGPGVQSQILKNAAQKKDVQLQNAGAWANLTAAAPAAAGGAAQAAAPAAAAGGEGVPVEDDNLWTEFQGREAQQLQAEEAKKAAEEAERRRKEEEREAMLREAQEAEARKQREAEAKAEAERAAREEKRQREVAQFQSMAAAAEAGKDPDILGGGGATGRGEEADLADLGLQAKDELSDDEDVPMEDI
ncbi:hypothetical protein D9Q98_009811 [Chlorella vulgaris]|uniref:Uncharacterized protein n=1 Tax=Chlorella vulgaris TaxID=3077 RepID=A0A9D4TF31_CHLVU|nr:hypothetical protein D9Q98_009811 [Chlorella vulgaris]